MAYLPLTDAQRDRANDRLEGFAAAGIVPDMAQVARGARLHDDLWESEGKVWFECRSCARATELEVDPKEFCPETAYCGESPRCLP